MAFEVHDLKVVNNNNNFAAGKKLSNTAAALFNGDGLCQVGGVSRGESRALDVGAVLADGGSAGVDGEDAADPEPV